jgi:ferredoxin
MQTENDTSKPEYMNQNQTESKPPSVEEPADEGLDKTICCDSFADLPFEEQVSQLAVELRALVWDDATDMMQGAMAGCPVECLAFAKWWIQRAKGLPTDVPDDYPVFRHNA